MALEIQIIFFADDGSFISISAFKCRGLPMILKIEEMVSHCAA